MTARTSVDEAYRTETRGIGSALGSVVRHTWWFGLGVLATIGEQTSRIAGGFVHKGREVEPSVVNPVRHATASLAEAAQPHLGRASETLRNVRRPAALRPAAAPTKEQFEQLAEEVRHLRERLATKADDED